MVARRVAYALLTVDGAFFKPMQKMLDYLKEKRDVGFFKSLSGLMMSCR